MPLTKDHADRRSLLHFGAEAAALLVSRDFHGLVDRFGYARAYDRRESDAIEADLAACLAKTDQDSVRAAPWQAVRYFEPNDSNLFAVIEYVATMPEGPLVLLELVVTESGSERHVTLEDISRA